MRFTALLILFGTMGCGLVVARADDTMKAVPQASKGQAPRPGVRLPQAPKPQVPKTATGVVLINRLAAMTPEERDKVLAALPPVRRAKILESLDKFNELTPLQQARTQERLERLNSLPMARQVELRDTMREFGTYPQDRRRAMNGMLGRLVRMPDEERRAFMESNGYRNKFSAAEQRMMSDLVDIFPRQ